MRRHALRGFRRDNLNHGVQRLELRGFGRVVTEPTFGTESVGER